MPTLVGFGTFAALPEEQISEKISCRLRLQSRLVTGSNTKVGFAFANVNSVEPACCA